MTAERITNVVVPRNHGDAHEALSMAECSYRNGWRGCDLIDLAKRAKDKKNHEHQTAIVELARSVLDETCGTCPVKGWAESPPTVIGGS